MASNNKVFAVTNSNGSTWDMSANDILLVLANIDNANYSDVTYIKNKEYKVTETITSLTPSQLSTNADNLFSCTTLSGGTTIYLNGSMVVFVEDEGSGSKIYYNYADDTLITYSVTESRATIRTRINGTSAAGISGSGTLNTVTKFTASAEIGDSQIFDNGTFVGVNASTITSAAERFQIKTSVDKYGWIHTDGNVRGGSYISLAGIWLGTQSNHSLSIFTNDGVAQAVFNTDGSFAVAGVVKADTHNTRDLGTSTRSWKDLYLGGTIIFEGATADAYETTLTVTDPSADRTITLPDATGTLALTDSITANYVIKSDGTKSVQSQIFDNGTFVAINDTTQTSASEKLLVKVSSDNYGVVHSDGTRIGGTYSDAVGFWFGSYSNHDVIFFTNNTDTPLILQASTGNVEIERDLIMSNGNGTSGTIIFEGATADTYQTTLTVADPTADRTITLPNASGTVSLQTGQTYTPSNVTTSRTFDADTVTLAELADIVGTLLTDLSGKVNN